MSFSSVLGNSLKQLINEYNFKCVTAAMEIGTGLKIFSDKYNDKYIDVGIAEEHAALFACGLATQGIKPFLTIYSTFMQRAFDMLIHDIGIQNLPVRLCMDRAGLSGDDGPTHHGLFDIGYLRHVPNFVFMQPKDEEEFIDMLWTMACYDHGPIAVRYPRGAGTGAKPKPQPELLPIGKSELITDGSDVGLIGLGHLFSLAEETREQLEAMGLSVALMNPRFIKPMDTGAIEEMAGKVKVICTFEDHVLKNGFGAAVIEHLHDSGIQTPVVRIGWPDEFIEHGNIPALREKHGITSEAAISKVTGHLGKKMSGKPSVHNIASVE